MIKKISAAKPPLVVLVVLDGFGLAKPNIGNAITLAKPRFFESLTKNYPYTELCASGRCVGLPPTQDGNSEAGHLNIGAGRVVLQDSVRISEDINDGSFFKNQAFESAYQHVKKNHSALHLLGMLSGVQSGHVDPDHLLALLTWARLKKIDKVYLHLFTDGRDSPKFSSLQYLEALLRSLNNQELVGTIMGRFYGMDRKKIWSRTELAYNALVLGEGLVARSPQAAITQSYNQGISDEFIPPYVLFNNNKPVPRLSDNDAVIFFNLRSDRARQLTKAFIQPDFNQLNPGSFKRKKVLKNLCFVALTDFGPDLDSILSAFPSIDVKHTLPIELAKIRQLYIAENEKYAHVTYFFNGGYANPVNGEKRILIPSPNVISYDQKPQMSAKKITQRVLKAIRQNEFDFFTINYANADMVGHTGNLEATIKAIKVVDQELKKLVAAVLQKNGTVIITADHGNAEEMIKLKTNENDTQHSSFPVPVVIVNKKFKGQKIKPVQPLLTLACIAPTILKLYQLPIPKEMTGKSLI
ncbi:MAG: 2,3-bisphosphoglycerate-independent phosphoglycerate mutase [Candidatus Buchananbacteria bacterium]